MKEKLPFVARSITTIPVSDCLNAEAQKPGVWLAGSNNLCPQTANCTCHFALVGDEWVRPALSPQTLYQRRAKQASHIRHWKQLNSIKGSWASPFKLSPFYEAQRTFLVNELVCRNACNGAYTSEDRQLVFDCIDIRCLFIFSKHATRPTGL